MEKHHLRDVSSLLAMMAARHLRMCLEVQAQMLCWGPRVTILGLRHNNPFIPPHPLTPFFFFLHFFSFMSLPELPTIEMHQHIKIKLAHHLGESISYVDILLASVVEGQEFSLCLYLITK